MGNPSQWRQYVHKLTAVCETCCGLRHPENQDSFLSDPSLGLFVVADGMSGQSAGEIASSQAAKLIVSYIREHISEEAHTEHLLQEAILAAHKEILALSHRNPDYDEMGTTVVIALIRGDRLWIAHVGDSRAYLITDTAIKQITHDHTFVADWLAAGSITPEDARKHPARHGLYMAVGIDDELEPDVSMQSWDKGDRVLLCTDGLTDILESTELLATVQSAHDGREACQELVRKAVARGEKDDITVMLVGHESREK
jgi:serine/threonine protein phosphatase PrpC